MHSRSAAVALFFVLAVAPRLALAGEAELATMNEDDPEHVGEAQQAFTVSSSVCFGACIALPAIGCGQVLGTCIAGTVLTIGGTAVPCVLAIPIACGAAGGIGLACWRICGQGDNPYILRPATGPGAVGYVPPGSYDPPDDPSDDPSDDPEEFCWDCEEE